MCVLRECVHVSAHSGLVLPGAYQGAGVCRGLVSEPSRTCQTLEEKQPERSQPRGPGWGGGCRRAQAGQGSAAVGVAAV